MKIHRICRTPDDPISILIIWKNEEIGLCNKCWEKVAPSDIEWGDDPTPTIESILSDEAKGLIGAVETEYVQKGSKKGDVEEETKDEDEEFY